MANVGGPAQVDDDSWWLSPIPYCGLNIWVEALQQNKYKKQMFSEKRREFSGLPAYSVRFS